MYEAAQIIGEAIRQVHERDAESLAKFGIDFNVSMIFGGQIKGERCRLFQMYSAGNFIESHERKPVFPDRRSKIRQTDHRPRDRAVDAVGRSSQMRADLDGFDAALEYLGRPAAGFADL